VIFKVTVETDSDLLNRVRCWVSGHKWQKWYGISQIDMSGKLVDEQSHEYEQCLRCNQVRK
jgi:hypothetical protein